jgi:ribosomal protein S18 acetylase RimI-like enzyme
VQYWCDSAGWVPGSEIVMRDDMVLINSALDFPGCNAALDLADARQEAPQDFINRVKDFFRGRRKYFSLILRAHDDGTLINYCNENKIYQAAGQPGMALDRPLQPTTQLPAGFQMRWVDDVQGVQDFSTVSSQAFLDLAFPADCSAGYFKQADRVLSPHSILAVVYSGEAPVCSAMAMLTHGIAGIYWVGTVKEARGKGLAEYCVREVGNAAFEMGARKVILQASHFGEPIYRRMGYREFTRYPWFICSSK